MTGLLSEEQQELLAGYVLYDLSPDEMDQVEQWMAMDPAIAEEIEQLQQAAALAYLPEEVSPPPTLRRSILQAYQAAAQTGRARRPSGFRSHFRWAKGLGALAALLIAGLSVSNFFLWRSLQQAQQPAKSLTVSLAPAENADPAGSATVTLVPATLEGQLTAQLPPLPESQVYVLWTVLEADAPFTTDEEGAILTHIFAGEQKEPIVLPPVYRDIRWVKSLAVTVEAAAAPQRHDSAPILIGQL
ncbi:MAG: anti-sigma factor [Cyanobacteria bacterium P01_A01_bin.135]